MLAKCGSQIKIDNKLYFRIDNKMYRIITQLCYLFDCPIQDLLDDYMINITGHILVGWVRV